MAKKSSQNRNVIKYLLFTVMVLLVTVSLLSLFIFKYTNLVSDSVLGAYVTPPSATLLCATCPGIIVLQKEGTNPKNWGAKCVTQQSLKNLTYIAYLVCPILTPIPRPSPVLTPYLRPTLTPHPEQTSR